MLATETGGEPSDRSRQNGRGDDIGCEDPGDLVMAGAKAALHMRQGNVGDSVVEGLHQGRNHGAAHDRPTVTCIATGKRSGIHGSRSASLRLWPVSISAVTLMPA